MIKQPHREKIEELIEQMTLSEKVAMLSGRNAWYTMPIERLDIPSIVMTDGPHGVRPYQLPLHDH
jgi:beta-glucosidase